MGNRSSSALNKHYCLKTLLLHTKLLKMNVINIHLSKKILKKNTAQSEISLHLNTYLHIGL